MEYKFKAWVKPVIEDGEVVYTGCMVDVWGIDFKRMLDDMIKEILLEG